MHQNHTWRYASRSALVLLLSASAVEAHNSTGDCTLPDADNCYTVIAPSTADTGMSVDGRRGNAEWAAAKRRNFSGGLVGSVHYLRSESAVYLFVDIGDAESGPTDQLSLYIDVNHDGAVRTDDVHIRIRRRDGITPEFMKSVGASGLSAWVPTTTGSAAAVQSTAANWTVELKITAAELGATALPAHLGLAVSGVDAPDDNVGSWPHNMRSTDPTTWADLSAPPVSSVKPAPPSVTVQ
jgi:hypothetical protein